MSTGGRAFRDSLVFFFRIKCSVWIVVINVLQMISLVLILWGTNWHQKLLGDDHKLHSAFSDIRIIR